MVMINKINISNIIVLSSILSFVRLVPNIIKAIGQIANTVPLRKAPGALFNPPTNINHNPVDTINKVHKITVGCNGSLFCFKAFNNIKQITIPNNKPLKAWNIEGRKSIMKNKK